MCIRQSYTCWTIPKYRVRSQRPNDFYYHKKVFHTDKRSWKMRAHFCQAHGITSTLTMYQVHGLLWNLWMNLIWFPVVQIHRFFRLWYSALFCFIWAGAEHFKRSKCIQYGNLTNVKYLWQKGLHDTMVWN